MTQQPGWGPQPPYNQPGQWGAPPPPPKKGIGVGGGIAIGCGGLLVLGFLLLVIGLFSYDGSSDDKAGRKPTPAVSVEAPTAKPSPKAPAKEEPAADSPVKVTAKNAKFTPSVLHDGGEFTSVTVTLVNNGDKQISTNPLYFTITDTTGVKHHAELGQDEHQMDLMKLAKGEKATGVITGKGKFTPAYVTYTDGMFGNGVRGVVS